MNVYSVTLPFLRVRVQSIVINSVDEADPIHTCNKILTWRQTLEIPADPVVSDHAKDLIKHLLCCEEERFSFSDIREHPFFDGIFDRLDAATPPFVPKLHNTTDTQHFEEFNGIEIPAPTLRNAVISKHRKTNLLFSGFSYNKPNIAMRLLRLDSHLLDLS